MLNEDMVVSVVIAIEAIGNQPEKNKIRDFEPVASAVALQWAMKTHILEEDQFVEFILTPWKEWNIEWRWRELWKCKFKWRHCKSANRPMYAAS